MGALRPAGLAAGLALLGLAACATPPDPSDPEAVAEFEALNDPLEPLNRYFFSVNMFLDHVLLRPAAEIYRGVIPSPGRRVVSNFLDNLGQPLILINDVLQGDFEGAGDTALRFATNTTVGVAGMFDVATDWGIPSHNEDFGQTLAVYGLGDGPYLVLPFLGPTNPRDGVGDAVDGFLDPLSYFYWTNHRNMIGTVVSGVSIIDARARNFEEINDLERTSIDFYAAVRSLYRQNRAALINDGTPTDQAIGSGLVDASPVAPPATDIAATVMPPRGPATPATGSGSTASDTSAVAPGPASVVETRRPIAAPTAAALERLIAERNAAAGLSD
ncbi:MlaA family lipoprotein [Zavarzinia sp. CC-PAN008]|uniref:MlaA family lipoprotein n=1 Tax=Zavarzinia sp. CC-PAN008 TaxID=3243332 RepID=UPI003F742728